MQEALWESEDQLLWLKGRGLTDATIAYMQLGYVPSDADSMFAHSVAIPYFDARDRWVMTRFRHLRPEAPAKYQTPKGAGTHLYNVKAVDEPTVAICEGEFDSLILGQLGIPAVAIPGATTWRREWRWLFRNADLVLVVMDNDEAGVQARNKITAQVAQITTTEPIVLPDGMDVTDLYLQDPEHLRRLLS